MPRIVAARYRVDGSRILVHVAQRAHLSRAFDGTVVTAATDSLDDASDHGWLVEASGIAHLEPSRAVLFGDRPEAPGLVASIEPMTMFGSTYHFGSP